MKQLEANLAKNQKAALRQLANVMKRVDQLALKQTTQEWRQGVDAKKKDEMRTARLNAAFCFFDTDGSGTLDLDEFFEIGKALNPNGWDDEKNEKAFDRIDKDGSGSVDLDEFIDFYSQALIHVDDKHFEKGIGKFVDAAKTVTVGKVDGLQTRVEGLEDSSQEAGMKQMKLMLQRQMKGSVATLVQNWKATVWWTYWQLKLAQMSSKKM